ncbi:hypothetical protein BH10PSE19_BH10PSE19_16600 [soil metagenome]
MFRPRACATSANSFCSFWGRVKDTTKKNYMNNATVVEVTARYIAKGISSLVWSTALNGVGTVVDRYWQPIPTYPPLFATAGIILGNFSILGQPLVKLSLMPVNGIFSVLTAFSEETVDSFTKWNGDFGITYRFMNDRLFFRYQHIDGHIGEMQPNPALIIGTLCGGITAITGGGEFFTKLTSFAFPFSPFIGLPAAKLAVPVAAAVGVAFARPATKMLSFTAGLFAIPIAPIYRHCKAKERADARTQFPGLGDQLERRSYASLPTITSN